MDPIGLDNVPRGMMAALAKWRKDVGGAIEAGGTANALTASTSSGYEAAHLVDGLMVVVKATADNSNATVTINVDSTGAKNVKRADGSALAVGSIKNKQVLILVYDADTTEWRAANIGPVHFDESGELTLTSSALSPSTSDGAALGTSSLMWSDLFLASGSVINFNNGDVTLTHSSNALSLGGGNFLPSSNDGAALGSASVSWSDLFIASGGVINFNNGDVTLTHSSNALSLGGGNFYPSANDGAALGSASVAWSDLCLAIGGTIVFGGNDVTLTHSSDKLSLTGGSFSVGGNISANGRVAVTKAGSATGGDAGVNISLTDISNNHLYMDFRPFAGSQAGSIAATGGGASVAFNTTSDGRLKPEEHRRPIRDSGAIIDALEPIYFRWKSGAEDLGFIAQDAYRVSPLFATPGTDDKELGDEGFRPWMMQRGAMEAVIVAEIQNVRRRLAASGL